MSAWMECDSCGARLFELTPAERQRVAEKPYNYVFHCYRCQQQMRGLWW